MSDIVYGIWEQEKDGSKNGTWTDDGEGKIHTYTSKAQAEQRAVAWNGANAWKHLHHEVRELERAVGGKLP